jgi:hypothetical protein
MEERNNAPSLLEELAEERRRREALEQRVNELVAAAQAAERSAEIRAELQRLGVTKVELAYRAVKDDLAEAPPEKIREYLAKFVAENPELMPARIPGGSGASAGPRISAPEGGVDLDKIRPGMSAEEMERVRQEIARVASQTLRGGW